MVINKKSIIQLVIISAGFIGTAFVLYNGFFSKPNQQAEFSAAGNMDIAGKKSAKANIAGSSEKILPFGNALDFDGVLSRQGLKYGIVTFPKLNTTSEVGVKEEDLIKPPPKKNIDNGTAGQN